MRRPPVFRTLCETPVHCFCFAVGVKGAGRSTTRPTDRGPAVRRVEDDRQPSGPRNASPWIFGGSVRIEGRRDRSRNGREAGAQLEPGQCMPRHSGCPSRRPKKEGWDVRSRSHDSGSDSGLVVVGRPGHTLTGERRGEQPATTGSRVAILLTMSPTSPTAGSPQSRWEAVTGRRARARGLRMVSRARRACP